MKKIYLKYFLLCLIIFPVFFSFDSNEEILAEEVISKMLRSVDTIYSLEYKLKNIERINKAYLMGEQLTKWQKKPYACYIYMIKPNEGDQVLFVENQNKNQVVYDPVGAPYFPVYLDPLGNLIRKNNHHTIFDLGLDVFAGVFYRYVSKQNAKVVSLETKSKNGMPHYVLTVEANYAIVKFVVNKEETLDQIAQRMNVSAYKLLELNKGKINDYDVVKKGIVLNIPNAYAQKIELWIEQKYFLPVYVKIWDEVGLFEVYEYTQLKINPKFTSQDFKLKKI
ncbi:MAG: hypothetical protein KatS3mg034_0751 [Vicingaceae bacterium]|nr:MAG: hypothetical protein KatS3mg034_0751 [Vicingaceae bacterium]